MKSEQFEKVLKERLAKIEKILSSKGKEYATNKDHMHNFNTASRIADCSPEKALLGMLMKHLVSVFDLVDKAETAHKVNFDVTDFSELWAKIDGDFVKEKIGDTINYFVLLEALLLERFESQDFLL